MQPSVTDKTLPPISPPNTQTGQVPKSSAAVTQPGSKQRVANRQVFKILVGFSFLVVVIASVLIAVLVFNLNQQLGTSQQKDPSTQLDLDTTPNQPEEPRDVDPGTTDPVIADPSEEAPGAISDPQLDRFKFDIPKDWIKYRNLDQGYSYLLPPNQGDYIFTDKGQTWVWQFRQLEQNKYTPLPGAGEFKGASEILFAPDNTNNFECEIGCNQENKIVIYFSESNQALEVTLTEIIVKNKVEMKVDPVTADEVSTEAPMDTQTEMVTRVELKKLDIDNFQAQEIVLDEDINPDGKRFILTKVGKRKILIEFYARSSYAPALQNMRAIVGSLVFEE